MFKFTQSALHGPIHRKNLHSGKLSLYNCYMQESISYWSCFLHLHLKLLQSVLRLHLMNLRSSSGAVGISVDIGNQSMSVSSQPHSFGNMILPFH